MYWMPSIESESVNGKREVCLRTRHFTNRIIFLEGTIDLDLANDFLSQMLYLEESDEPVTLYINSPGGSVTAGLMIYDCIQGSRLPIDIVCAGMAASMAAVILAGGKKGRRFILPHSKVVIHEPWVSDGLGGSATSIKSISDSILETREVVNGLLAKHTGRSIKTIHKATSFDNMMDAQAAVKFGIVDAITTSIRIRK